MKPTYQEVREKLLVDVESGTATWIDPTKHHRALIGEPAGCETKGRNGKNYWVIRINGKGYKRSHIVYLAKTGDWPASHIDHIDGNSLNDRGENLRLCTHAQNMWNMKPKPRRSGLPAGVRRTTSGKFQARIRVSGRSIALGSYEKAEEAYAEYTRARAEHFGEFA